MRLSLSVVVSPVVLYSYGSLKQRVESTKKTRFMTELGRCDCTVASYIHGISSFVRLLQWHTGWQLPDHRRGGQSISCWLAALSVTWPAADGHCRPLTACTKSSSSSRQKTSYTLLVRHNSQLDYRAVVAVLIRSVYAFASLVDSRNSRNKGSWLQKTSGIWNEMLPENIGNVLKRQS